MKYLVVIYGYGENYYLKLDESQKRLIEYFESQGFFGDCTISITKADHDWREI